MEIITLTQDFLSFYFYILLQWKLSLSIITPSELLVWKYKILLTLTMKQAIDSLSLIFSEFSDFRYVACFSTVDDADLVQHI